MKRLLTILILILTFLYGCEEAVFQPNPEDSGPAAYERLFDDTNEKSFTIEVSLKAFNQLDQYMVDYFTQYGDYKTDAVVNAKMIYEDTYGRIEADHIAFRSRGNTSRTRLIDDAGNLKPASYKIYFDKPVDFTPGSVLEKTIKNRTIFDMTELNFKFNRNYDSTYISEKYAYDLFRSYGVPAPRATHAKFYLKIGPQTHFLGLYNVIESIDASFLNKRFPDADHGNLYKVLWQQFGPASLESGYDPRAIGIKDESKHYFPNYDLKTNKKAFDITDIQTLIQSINELNGEAFRTYLESHFEVDRLIRLLAIGALIGNPDDYRAMGNNYYLYRNPVTQKWIMMPYDYDHGLHQGWDGAGLFASGSIGLDIYEWANLNTILAGYPVKHPLTDKLFQIPDYQLKYELYLQDLVESNRFSYESFHTSYVTVKNLYDTVVMHSLWPFGFGLRQVEQYFEGKQADIQSQLSYYRNNPSKRP